MKRIFGFLAASMLGGLISYALFSYNNPKQNIVETAKENSAQENIHPVKYETPASIDFTNAAEHTVAAVVHVKVRNKYSGYDNPLYNFLFGLPTVPQNYAPITGAGSGVIISNDGYIVTNNHVIEGADILEVTLDDKRTYEAEIVGTDPNTDIALIKIKETNLPFISWGDSDELKVGEWVLAVGNPFNLASTVTAGIVSAKARSINIINKRAGIEAFIQTDAAVNPGNSGGALVNTKGELIGINTAIASPTGTFSGYSFAVPQRIAEKVVRDLLEYGTIQRAYIGVVIQEISAEFAKEKDLGTVKGVFVNDTRKGGAADEAGIQTGDVILKIGNIDINSMSELQEQVGQHRPGDQITVKVLRNRKVKDFLVTLRNVDGGTEFSKASDNVDLMGATLENVSTEMASKLRLKGGVVVKTINDGKLQRAGVKEGFIITRLNQQPVYSIDDIKVIASGASGGVYLEGVYPNGIRASYAFGM